MDYFNQKYLHMKNLIYLTLLLFLSSCIKDEFDMNKVENKNRLNSSVAVPIGFRNNTLKEILKLAVQRKELVEDADGMLYFKYKGQSMFKANSYTLIPILSALRLC